MERYRGRGTRHVCPQCHRKGTFTRYIDTHNNNIYISENVGKCNRLDKCGYHYTPKQYFTDNPWKSEVSSVQKFKNDRVFERLNTELPRPIDTIPEWVWEYSRSQGIVSEHHQWLERLFSPPFYHPRLLRISANFPIFVEKNRIA